MSDLTSTPIEANAVFAIELVQSGRRLDVPADQTVLQVLEAAGHPRAGWRA